MKYIFGVILFGITLSRLLYLSADPPQFLPSSVIGDEGYWVHNARLSALFGRAFTDDFVEDVNIAPFLSFMLRISFALFGVGFWQARLVPALFGIGSVMLFWYLVKAKSKSGYLGGALFGGSYLFFAINRLAMGESPAIFWLVLSFLFIVKKSWFWTGIFWGMAVLSKSNAILVLPGLLAGLILTKNIKTRDIIEVFLVSGLVILTGFFLVEKISGRSVWETYSRYSGTDYLVDGWNGLYVNLKSFIKNDIWRRHGAWLIVIPVIWQIFRGQKTPLWSLGAGLVMGQTALIAPFSNQGADHRFLFLWLGMFILFSSAKKRLFKFAGSAFVIWQMILIITYLNSATFSLTDESKKIGELSQRGQIITGFFSHQMVLENELYPLYWAPGHEKFKGINADIDEWKPNFLLQMFVVDGRDGKVFTPLSQVNLGLKQEVIDRFEVLPMNDGYQVVASLRRINW